MVYENMSVIIKYHKDKMAEDYERLEWDFLKIKNLDKKSLRKLSNEINF